jgi:hypothetical protein
MKDNGTERKIIGSVLWRAQQYIAAGMEISHYAS